MDATLTLESSPIPGRAEVFAAAHSPICSRLAVLCGKDDVKIYGERGGRLKQSACFKAQGLQFNIDSRVSWAAVEFGQVLAVSQGRSIQVWAEPLQRELEEWRLLAELQVGCIVRDIAFSPKEFGAQLAVAAVDGLVRIYDKSASLGASDWDLTHTLRVGQQAECTALCWRGTSVSVGAPTLVVGTSEGAAAVWQHNEAVMTWEECVTLQNSKSPITCLTWSAPLNQQVEMVAVGDRESVCVWAIKGGHGEGLKTDLVSTLDVDSPVWKIEWNMLGSILAVSEDSGAVLLYTQSLLGKYELTCRLIGAKHDIGPELLD